MLKEQLRALIDKCSSALLKAGSITEVNNIRAVFLGKDSMISSEMRNLSQKNLDERKDYGRELNLTRIAIEEAIKGKVDILKQQDLHSKLQGEKIDITAPGHQIFQKGEVHCMVSTIKKLQAIMSGLGFQWTEGPEIEEDWYNFTALNIPEYHPARQMHDTFYIANKCEKGKTMLLRTHTSPSAIRYMAKNNPPLAVASVGTVYRKDYDATHMPMFHQLDCWLINKDASFANMKYVIMALLRSFFSNPELPIRFRNSYFPFTEPSFELDIKTSNNKWMEVGGCGMIHPKVLEAVGVEAGYCGFAFGMGLERMTMLEYDIKDIRLLYS